MPTRTAGERLVSLGTACLILGVASLLIGVVVAYFDGTELVVLAGGVLLLLAVLLTVIGIVADAQS